MKECFRMVENFVFTPVCGSLSVISVCCCQGIKQRWARPCLAEEPHRTFSRPKDALSSFFSSRLHLFTSSHHFCSPCILLSQHWKQVGGDRHPSFTLHSPWCVHYLTGEPWMHSFRLPLLPLRLKSFHCMCNLCFHYQILAFYTSGMIVCPDCVLSMITLLPCEKLHQHLDFLIFFSKAAQNLRASLGFCEWWTWSWDDA